MGRIGLDNSGKFSSGQTDYFQLVDDGDTAVVTFLYDDPDGNDMDFYVVHPVEIDGRRKYIGCNAVDGDTDNPDNCPLCQEKFKRQERLFLQLYNHDTQKVEVWERGQSFVAKIIRMIKKFEFLVEQDFEIERIGKKGDQRTTYEITPVNEVLDRQLDEFPDRVEIEGNLILKLTDDELWDVVDGNYKLPGADDNNGRQPRERAARGSSRPRGATNGSDGAVRRGPRSRSGRESF